ncbi:MAG TPA: CPBP family intramembrane glutamic endopeptidase [Candidatus Sericytochromatia bacterium]|jgi:membrane protease YdiL (CAAX protease family)
MNTDSNTIAKNPFLHFKARSLLLGGFLISIAIGLGLGLLSGLARFDSRDPVFVPVIYCLTFILLSLWAIQGLHQSKIKVKRLIGHLPSHYPWLPTIGIVISILLFSLGSGQLFYYALSFANPTLVESLLKQKSFLSGSETFSPLLHNLLIVVAFLVVAPVTEEFIFRGILLHRWTAKWGVTPALLTSALLFGFLHANIVGLFVFGLMMALLYIKTRTLIVPIVCHALNNLAAIGLELISQNSDTTEAIAVLEQLRAYWWLGLVYVVLSLPWLITFIYQNWPKPSLCLPYFTNIIQ